MLLENTIKTAIMWRFIIEVVLYLWNVVYIVVLAVLLPVLAQAFLTIQTEKLRASAAKT